MVSEPNCINISHHSGDLGVSQAEELVRNGVHTVILGTGPGSLGRKSESQAEAAISGGLLVEAYCYMVLGAHMGAQAWIDEARKSLGSNIRHVKRFWVDMEDSKNEPDWTPDLRAEYYSDAVEMAKDIFPNVGVYTASWYWKPQKFMGNTEEFSDLPLWNAAYDSNPDVSRLPYGGWTKKDVAIEQYQGDTGYHGVHCNLNFMYHEVESPISELPQSYSGLDEEELLKIRSLEKRVSVLENHTHDIELR